MQSVTTALTKLPGITRVQVDLPTGHVSYANTGGVPRERVAAAIRDAGFEPQ